ncbi:MAG: tetratricopeptide repeat protein [Minwuia sp.]|nr:tetratricopeptide repeat protein [Minwuia sp.]
MIAAALHRTLEIVIGLPDQQPHPSLPKRLDSLFRDLATPESANLPFEIEDLIWAVWCEHSDAEVAERMQRAITAIASGEHESARRLLDDLCARQPQWAEAWNKRATLHYIAGRHELSLNDIQQTLLREPRHFGALSGFGQICLQHGDSQSARLAFEAALRINPHLAQVRGMLDRLGDMKGTMN